MIFKYNNIQLKSVVGVVGQNIIDLTEFELENMTKEKSLKYIKNLGFEKVRMLSRPLTTADMCVKAVNNLLKSNNISPSEIDCFILITQTPDCIVPATSFSIQEKLGLSEKCVMLDINQGCAGFVLGLYYASTFIASRSAKNVLLCVGDTTCCAVKTYNKPRQEANSLIFGDGASAALISTCDEKSDIYFNIYSHGYGWSTIHNNYFSSKRIRSVPPGEEPPEPNSSHIDGVALANYALGPVKDSIQEIVKYSNLTMDDISYCIAHQGNKVMLKSIALSLGQSISKVPFLAGQTGNLSSASIPVALSDNYHNLPLIKEKPTLLSGFGVGLTSANCILDLSNTNILDCLEL